jgi:hypothetical protein
MNLAILYSAAGRDDEANEYYVEALKIRKEVLGKNHPSYFRALENVGLHSLALGKISEAEEYFRETIEIQIGQIKTIFAGLSLRDQEIFYDRLRSDVDRYNFIAFSLLDKNPDLVHNILDYQLKTKSILFTPSEKIQNRIINSNDKQLRNDFFNWKEGKQLLANYYRIGEQQLDENNISLNSVESDLVNKERILVSQMSEFESILPRIDISWQNIQNKVKLNEAIVEIVQIREFQSQTTDDGMLFGFTNLTQYLAIIFNNETVAKPEYAIIGDGFRYEDDQFDIFKNAFVRGNENFAFEYLWKPIHDKLGDINRVHVTPDGIFNKINPNAFKINDSYVLDKYFVTYLTSGQDMFREDAEILSKKSMFFGNPNFDGPSTNDNLRLKSQITGELEINSVATILEPEGWDNRIFSRGDATELRLKSAYNPTILHINSQGYFSKNDEFFVQVSVVDNPAFNSGIYLTGAAKTYEAFINGIGSNELNDGFLTTYEAMGLDLNRTELVVLSAPEPGAYDIENVDGLYGLQRAFITAGAKNLLTSFSNVNANASSELIVLFYYRYMETENLNESLRFAQQKLRTKYNDPRIWGSYMLVGNG